MNNSYHTKNGRTSKRGAFINGIWHCDCEPRLPAEKFQTKNGVFTCQKPQPKRCSFFLWSDDAKVREESAVINNSRTESDLPAIPKTPTKSYTFAQPPTPVSKARSTTLSPDLPKKRLFPSASVENKIDESFSWSSSGDEELAVIAEAVTRDEQSPNKVARTLFNGSPGKRTHGQMAVAEDDAPRTINTSSKFTALLSPWNTESKQPRRNDTEHTPSSLAAEALKLLQPAKLSPDIEHELVELLNRHDLRTQGIARGRDITRLAVQAKDKKIGELQARIAELEAEKETSRTVIAHLKQDIATSPKRAGRSRFGNRSEI